MKLVVEKSTASSNGGFINTLTSIKLVEVKLFGVTELKEVRTAYHFKTSAALTVGAEDDVNMQQFDIIRRDFIGDDGKTASALWLAPKRDLNVAVHYKA
jgi:hypothetical protein